jgi:hypothetical protein
MVSSTLIITAYFRVWKKQEAAFISTFTGGKFPLSIKDGLDF